MNRETFIKNISGMCELLGNPLRMKIFLKVLKEGCECELEEQEGITGNCVSGIMKELNIPQSTASTYLRDLSRGGLIECQKNGKFLYCRPKKEALLLLKTFIDGSLSQIKFNKETNK